VPDLPNDDAAPADVVPRPALTRETVELMDRLAGRQVEVTWPGRIIEDVDGIPNAVTPATTTVASVAGFTITRAEADRLGIDPTNYPNVRIIDTEERPHD
jgi:hypothetical protein